MWKTIPFDVLLVMAVVLVTSTGWIAVGAAAASGQGADIKAEFLELCDAGCRIVQEQARAAERKGRAFYWDSYVVRALCVAYDMTGKQEYLDACKLWSDRMIEFQNGMIPKGAYYMQYGRRPGQDEGGWYVADSSSIALGVLATAIRCDDPQEKKQYLDSVKSFAELVAENFVRPSGGVTDGYWPKSDEEWWCSTGIFGSLAFCLYDETGDPSYLKMGLGTIDWLNRQDLLTVAVHFPPDEIKPTVMMYCLEAYSAGLPHLKPGPERHKAAMAQLTAARDWMSRNLGGRAGIDYVSQWGGKFGGLPFHLYVYARHVPGSGDVVQMADRELCYIADVLANAPPANQRDQLALFAMMSYAERLSPGSMYRTSRRSLLFSRNRARLSRIPHTSLGTTYGSRYSGSLSIALASSSPRTVSVAGSKRRHRPTW